GAQEGDSGGQLRTSGIRADTAMPHCLGGLSSAPELHESQRWMAAPQLRVREVRVASRGLDVDAGRVRLDALGQRVAKSEVVSHRPGVRGRGARRERGRGRYR